MRQKVRRFSKSAISVLLSVMMVASLVTVGIVNTSAYTFTTNHKIYFDATKWTSRTKVYVNFLNSSTTYGNLQEMTQIGSTGIYRYENSSVSGTDNLGVMFVTNDGWSSEGRWDTNNSYNTMQHASNCTKYYRLDLNKDHVYYFRASGANKEDAVYEDKDYDDNQKTINHDTVRNTDRVWAFNLTATSSVADTEAGTPATDNASSSAGGEITVNASYFNGWDSVSDTGDCEDSSTTTTYSNAAKGCTATWKVKQVYSGYEFDGWYSDASSTGSTNRLSADRNYTETVTGDFNGTITRYAHFHRAKSTVNTAVSPSGAGTAYISKTSTVGTDTSVSNITDGDIVYLQATANPGYTFSNWKTVSGLTYANENNAGTTATVTANATATAEFTANTYTITKQNPEHARIKVPAEATTGSKVTPSATTDAGWKVTKYKYSTDGTTWTDVTPGSSFTMPASNVTVTAVVEACSMYTVTLNTAGGGQGSVLARTSEGQTISSGDVVNEGTVITFTASAAENNAFGGWSGTGSASSFSGTDASKTATITEDTTVTASFSENVVQVAYYGTSDTNTGTTPSATYSMTLLDSGYYRSSTKLNNGACFTVKKTVGDVTTYAKSGASGTTWYINSGSPVVTPQHWTSDDTINKKYKNATGSASYVFYDPAQNKIWLSTSADGLTGVTIYAKDGSFTGKTPGANPPTSAGWGSTTLTVSTDGGSTWSNGTDVFDGNAQTATLRSAQVDSASTKIKVSTTVSKSDYYVYGYDINGCITKTATDKGSNTYELEFSPSDVETNLAGYIEITPIYMLIDPSTSNPGVATNTIRFYVRGFAGDVEARWGGELYCYAYKDTTTITNGNWPGQPMINLGGGTYYMDLPINTKAITLSNAAADWIHAKTLGINLSGTEQETWDRRNEYQCQTYDYDDFQYIYAKPGVGANDEDIIFDFRYKHGEWGISGKDNFNLLTSSSNETSFPDTLTPGEYSGWEKYTDFYDEPIDLWGTKLTGNFDNNPVRVVVQGYYDTTAANSSFYATTYVVYKPESFTGSPGTYSLVNYTNSSEGYGKKSRSEFLQRSAKEMGLTSLAGQPVQITYEYAIYKNMSTKGSHPLNQTNQFAERADGVWYYSETKPVKGKVLIQYADNMRSAFSDDTFAIDEDNPGTDYDGDDYTVNEGTVTKAKAYFVDNNYGRSPRTLSRPTNAPFNVDYDGRTVEWAYSDGYDYYDVKAEDPADGEYTFVGWYKLSSSGIALATTDYTYSFEATTNETFIARYVKVPSGVVKLAHKPVVTGNSGGNGDRKVWYDIVDSNNTSVLPSGTTQEANGQITVPKSYVKYGKDYVLKVKFEVEPDSNSLKHGIYSTNEAATANLLTEAGLETHNHNVNVGDFALTPSGTTATLETEYVTFNIPMDQFFKLVEGTGGNTGNAAEYEFDADKSLIEVFSDFDRIKNDINITKSVDYNNGEKFKFKVEEEYVPNPDTPEVTAWRNYNGYYTVGEGTTQTSFNGIIQNIGGGQIFHILGVPAGVKLRIVEVENTNTNYVCDGVTSFSGDATSVATYGNGKSFVMGNNGDVDMTFKNRIKTEDVVITKTVEGGTPESGTTFPIHVTYQTTNGTTVTAHTNEAITTLAVGTNVTLSNVPVGSLITISEDSKAGYVCKSITGNSAITDNNDGTFTVVETNDTPTITVANAMLHDVSITKVTDYANDFISTFKMQVLVSTDGDVDANYHPYQQSGSLSGTDADSQDITASVAQNGSIYEHPIHKGDTLYLTGLQPGTWVKILETGTTDNYTHYGTSVTGATNDTEITPSSGAKGIKFQIGSADPAVTITNHVIKKTVTVYKKTYENLGTTDNPNLVNFPYEDGSRFGIEVLWKPLGTPPDGEYAAMPNGNVKELSNSDGTPEQPDANNLYWVRKDGSITFTDVPKGSYITVTETNNHITDSDVTKAPRFLFFDMVNTGAIEHGNGSSKYYSVGDSAVSFVVQNIVKKNTVTVTKSTNNQNTTDAHTIKIHIYKNGWASSTGNTPDEYSSITYTSSVSGPASSYKNANISIHGGETLTFRYPVGCVFTIQETAPHANYDIKTEDNGHAYDGIQVTGVPNVSGIADPTYDRNSHTLSFQTADAAATATIYNEVKTKALTITKATNASSTTDTFKIKLYKSADGTTWTQYTDPLTIGQTTRTATNGEYTISKNESLVMSGIEINTFVKIEESDPNTTAGYRFDGMSGGNVTVDSTNCTGVVQMDGDKTVTITNSLITRTIKIKKTVDYTYDNETSFPITVEYKDTTDNDTWKTVSGSPTSITASDSWTDVTLTGQPAVSEIRVTETLDASTTHYGTPSLSVEGATKVNGDSSDTAVAFNFDGNNTPQVTIANHAKTANVTVKKELITGDTNSPFAITLSHKKPGADSFTDVPYSLANNATSSPALSLPVGTIVKVTETADTVEGYELDSMQKTVGSAAATAYTAGSEYEVTSDDVLFTVKNKLKTFTVTIVKEVVNEAGTPISDSSDFNISYTNGTAAAVSGIIRKGNDITVNNVPYGTTFTVSETNLPRGYTLKSITGNGEVTGNKTITITNTKLPTYTLTLSKNADGTPGDTEFGITVSSAIANGNYSYQIGSNASVAFDSNSKVITLKSGESAVISGLLAGETLTFAETNQGIDAGYTFDHFTVNGSDRESTVTTLNYEVSAGTNNIVVHNVKSAPDEYHYKITYTYPSRFQFIPEKASRFGDQSYTVEGVLLSNDQHFSEYFDTTNRKITKALILDKAPHESNFMMNMTWDKDGDSDANFGEFGVDVTSGTPVYTGSVRMIEEEQSTKTVQFIFPYETTENTYSGMCKVVYVPSDFANPVKLLDKQTTPAIQVEYQGEVVASDTREVTYTENGETKTKNETFYFHTTAPSQFDGGNFLYWSIRAKNVNTGNFVEVARSYNEIFNYTIFDNYQIEPIYTNSVGVDTSDEANYKATAQFAKLNLLAITRNQWNNGDKGSENVNLKGEDMVYLDFDLAYAFNDYMLSKNTKTLETGLLIQDCGVEVDEEYPLNLDGDQTKLTVDYAYYEGKAAEKETANTLKSASDLQALVLETYQACGTSGSKTEPEDGLTRYAIGKVLTNKNRYELGVTNVVGKISQDNTDVLTGWNYDPFKKTHVYRAYAYIRNTKVDAHGVILSEPVYFTMKNIAEQ